MRDHPDLYHHFLALLPRLRGVRAIVVAEVEASVGAVVERRVAWIVRLAKAETLRLLGEHAAAADLVADDDTMRTGTRKKSKTRLLRKKRRSEVAKRAGTARWDSPTGHR